MPPAFGRVWAYLRALERLYDRSNKRLDEHARTFTEVIAQLDQADQVNDRQDTALTEVEARALDLEQTVQRLEARIRDAQVQLAGMGAQLTVVRTQLAEQDRAALALQARIRELETRQDTVFAIRVTGRS